MGNFRMRRGTWYMAPKLTYDMTEVSGTARWVYGFLCRCANEENISFPSYRKIMEACDIGSRATVSKAIKELVSAGLLIKEVRYKKQGAKGTNLYTVITDLSNNEPLPVISNEELKFLKGLEPALEHYSHEVLLDILLNKVFDVPAPASTPPDWEPEGRNQYGHNKEVYLTDEEYMGLVNEFGAETVTDFIEQLDSRIAGHGEQEKYVNHYATLRRWVKRWLKEEAAKPDKNKNGPKRNRFANFKSRERDYEEIERLEREHSMKSVGFVAPY
jgi:DNA-binding transcriptional MocR family regulator